MTNKEKALIYFKDLRARKVEDYSSVFDTAPKDSVVYGAVSAEIEMYDAAIKALEQEPKTGYWIADARTYYEELKKRGLGVDEYTPYFTDDIACSECLAKYSTLDNETQFFKHCPNCGADMREVKE